MADQRKPLEHCGVGSRGGLNSFSGDSHSESFVDNVARASRDGKSENAANAPTTADASRLLEDRGLVVIPDIVANAGGVTCSYFEQLQGQTNHYWDRADVLGKVDLAAAKDFRRRLRTRGARAHEPAGRCVSDCGRPRGARVPRERLGVT